MNLKKTLLVGSLFCGVYVFPLYAETPYSESETIEQQKGIRVSGTVIDKEKNTLPGVNIMVKGSSGGTITDIDGHFYIEVPDKSSILVITYVGFKTQEIPVGNDINFNITLLEDVEALDEVVVVGYGNQKKLSVIGSVQTLEPAKLQVGSSRSMSNNLAGQLAGVIAVQPSGEPGYDNSNFWIRGISSFSGNTSPLVLVDGVERSLNDIDPAEIESFSVLKDASASAMYGVRGANGVILINTKRGSVYAPSVNLRVEQSIQAPTKLPQFIGAAEYMSLLNTLQSDPNKRLFTKDQILKTYYGYDKDLYPDVDWIDAITKDYANSTRANLTVSGGTEILRYSLTASLYHENGIMGSDKTLPYDTQSKLNRYNIRANVDLDLTKTTLLRFNVGGYLQNLRKSRSSTDELFQAAFETPPFVHPAVYSDGTIPRVSNTRKNPWAMNTQNGYYRGGKSKLESLFSLEQNLKMITPGLKMKVTFAFDTYNENFVTRGKEPDYYSVAKSRNDEGELAHSILSYGSEFLDHSSNANYGNQSTYLEAAVTYNRTFDKHALDALFHAEGPLMKGVVAHEGPQVHLLRRLFQLRDLRLLLQVLLHALLIPPFLLDGIKAVISAVKLRFSVLYLDDPRHGPVQEIPVMADGQHRAPEPPQIPLQPLRGLQVQMVRGLVQQQDVRILQNEPSQVHPGLLSAGQTREFPLPHFPRDGQAVGHLVHRRLRVPAAQSLEFGV